MIYIVLLAVTLCGSLYFDLYSNTNYRKGWLFFETLLLICVVGFRYKVGGDTLSYMESYSSTDYLYEIKNFDVFTSRNGLLWFLFCYLCKLISPSFLFFQLVHALIVNCVFVRFFYKHSLRYFTAIFLYTIFAYLNYNTEILRASLAVCVFLLIGYDALKQKKWFLYILSIIISWGFHAESFALLILPICHILGKVRVTFIRLIAFAILSYGVLIFLNSFAFIQRVLINFQFVVSALDLYSLSFDKDINLFGYITCAIQIIPCLIAIYLSKNVTTDSSICLNRGILFLYVFCVILSLKFSVIFVRCADFVRPVVILTIASLSSQLYNVRNRSILIKLAFFFFIFFSLFQYKQGNVGYEYWRRYYPYSTYLQPDENVEREIMMYNYRRGNY